MREKLGLCGCGHYGYLFASGCCMTCEDRRLVGAFQESHSEEDGEMLAMFREYVREVAYG